MNKLFQILFVFILVILIGPQAAQAQTNIEIKATIQSLTVTEGSSVFTAVDSQGTEYTVDSSQSLVGELRYSLKEGQDVLLQRVSLPDGTTDVFLADVVRTNGLLLAVLFFAIVVVAVGRKRGFSSLVGLAITLAVLFGVIIPKILTGTDPVMITVLGSAVILLVNLHLTHGFNKQTFSAYLSTLIGLLLAWGFSAAFVSIANLSGLASDESALLFLTIDTISLPSGLLLAGFILGAVGVLDDIAITQTETVAELHSANPKMKTKELYTKAMNVGRHHIASVVNTLVLAYAGVALPVFLLFALRDDIGFMRLLNEEVIAVELMRTLSGTIALILLVPISTYMATRLFKKN
jgi:uncharacterized membrane protein